MKKVRATKGIVRLIAFDLDGKKVIDENLELRSYFEDSHPLLDETSFRKEHRIARVRGTIYNRAGAILEEFKFCYDREGLSVAEATLLENGTAVGDWEGIQPASGKPSPVPVRPRTKKEHWKNSTGEHHPQPSGC